MENMQSRGLRYQLTTSELIVKSHSDYLRQSLPDFLGLGVSDVYSLDLGLNVIETRFKPCKDLVLCSQIESHEPKLVVTLAIEGQSLFTSRAQADLVFKQGYTTITVFNASTGERHYQEQRNVLQLRFILAKPWLQRYFGEHRLLDAFSRNDLNIVSQRKTHPQSLIQIQSLLNPRGAHLMRPLLKHSLVLSILDLELAHLFEQPTKPLEKYSERDRAMADTARDILSAEFKNPPSVADLATRVGTNSFKLKKLFHHFFNSTPYGLLFEIRMQQAYALLKAGDCQVAVVADKVGYLQASNFSAAFTKHFGVCPKAIAKHH